MGTTLCFILEGASQNSLYSQQDEMAHRRPLEEALQDGMRNSLFFRFGRGLGVFSAEELQDTLQGERQKLLAAHEKMRLFQQEAPLLLLLEDAQDASSHFATPNWSSGPWSRDNSQSYRYFTHFLGSRDI